VLAALSRRRHLAVSGDIEAAVLGDELQLTQLLGNVVAATPRAERLVVAVDQGTVRVAIASLDAPLFADCTRVFEEFHRATGADGTGLELPLARALAELQGGRLELVDDSLLHLSLVSAP
jgi:signal transduction histidine kinase